MVVVYLGERTGEGLVAFAVVAECSDVAVGQFEDQRPEVCRTRREMVIRAEHLTDLVFGKGPEEPRHGLFVSVLEYAFDRVDRVRGGIEFFKVRIPKQ